MISPASVAEVMGEADLWWAMAGGWAIDLWLGEETRDHHDVEVVVRRSDQRAAFTALVGRWSLWKLDPPGSGWQPWDGRAIEPPAFQLQARSALGEFDLFTERVTATTWQFRRDARITLPAADLCTTTTAGIPIVRPEVQLLYMARSDDPKNQRDFEVARPRLDDRAARWLATALATTAPGHRWLAALPTAERPPVIGV